MTELSGSSSAAGGTPGASDAPNWALVPFDVGCARCGCDLRGLTEPVCPSCGLTFDWNEAVPIQRLTCLRCGYHLFGLQETRCPECGKSFSWDQVLAEYHRRRQLLFEYRWRDRPLRSFFGSILRALWPPSLWKNASIYTPVRVAPLVSFSIGCVFLLFAGLTVLPSALFGVEFWCSASPGRYSTRDVWYRFLDNLQFALGSRFVWAFGFTIVFWMVAVLGALMILRQSMRRCKVRNVHVVRIIAYALPVWPAVGQVAFFLVGLAIVLITGQSPFDALMLAILASVLILSTWSIYTGYRNYLRMPRSVGVAVAAQLIAILFVLCVLSIVTIMSS